MAFLLVVMWVNRQGEILSIQANINFTIRFGFNIQNALSFSSSALLSHSFRRILRKILRLVLSEYLALLLLLVTKVLEPGLYLNRKLIKLFSQSWSHPRPKHGFEGNIFGIKILEFVFPLRINTLETFPSLFSAKVAKVLRLTFVFRIEEFYYKSLDINVNRRLIKLQYFLCTCTAMAP